MKKSEVQELIDAAVKKALEEAEATTTPPINAGTGVDTAQSQNVPDIAQEPAVESITKEDIEKMVEEGVVKALAPFLKARGIASNLNDDAVEKSAGDHYLKGIL